MREWLARLVDWFRRDRLDRELEEELGFHASQLERDAVSSGIPQAAASLAARRQLGNLTQVREEARDRWSWPWLDRLGQDLRYAVRGLRRSPGFTFTVVATLGLGIGANAAMFSVIDRLMFRPHPYLRAPDEVHRIYLRYTYRGETFTNGDGLEYTRYLDLRRWTTGFDQFAAFTSRSLAVGSGQETRERPVAIVSASFFGFFDIRPVAGRFFGPAEDSVPAGAPVAVLGYNYWKNELGGREMVGQTLKVRNIVAEVVGVAPEGFVGVSEGEPPDVFVPITSYAAAQGGEDAARYYTSYNWGWMAIMARRSPGVSEADASADLTAAYLRSWQAERDLSPSTTPAEQARPEAIAGPLRTAAGPGAGLESQTLLWVSGVAVIVLLIACANVANLMLARVVRRRRETAVRLAVGVSRRRLLAQGLTESLLLSALGCVAGIALAQWGGIGLRRLFVQQGELDVVTDWRTLGVAAAFALFAGIVTGIGPALVAGRGDLAGALKAGVREGGSHRSGARTGLSIFQAALSVILLIGAGLFVKSLDRVRSLRLGYDTERVLMVSPNLRGASLGEEGEYALGIRLMDRARALPSVENATLVSSVPFWSSSSTYLAVPGIDSVRRLGRFTYQTSTPEYFVTMGTRILRGRAFSEADRDGAPRVAVVSEAMAGVLWPGADAIGQCMRVGADTMPCTTVIGVAENAVQNSLVNDQLYRYYLPMTQYGGRRPDAVLLRMRGDPGAEVESVRATLQREMPGDGYVTVMPLERRVERTRRSWQLGATMFVAFGGLALLVAGIGLYGVITYNVSQRMHELGVRTALGARAADLVRLVVGQGLRFAAAGTVIGVAVALVAARWIQPLLFRQSATDPATYSIVAGLLLIVALVASAVPAARATRADPNTALRSD